MQKTVNLEFELIQVAIGVRDRLSKIPSEKEWKKLYSFAEKQSLVGICFAGIERLPKEQLPNMDLLMDWLGQVEYIKTVNKEVNRHCIEIQNKFAEAGYKSCILKGQGVAALYNELAEYRNSGDIDLLVEGNQKDLIKLLQKEEPDVKWDYVHAHYHYFPDTEVEVHYRPCVLYNLNRNKELQKWFSNNTEYRRVRLPEGEITVPSSKYNKLFLLIHAYHHLLNGGIGLRQMMDYYFVLRSEVTSETEKEELNHLFDQFGLTRFAKAVMWVMLKVFCLEDNCWLCRHDEQEGEFLLNEILEGGNFGHFDSRYKERSKHDGRGRLLLNKMHNNMHLLSHYSNEVMWAPIYFIWHFLWKRTFNINR